jgi:hypothetical protein
MKDAGFAVAVVEDGADVVTSSWECTAHSLSGNGDIRKGAEA